MSIQPLIFKNGVYTLPRSPTDVSALLATLGLNNVNNTSDLTKPISTATQTALDLKANITSANLLGTPTVPTATAGTNTTQAASTAFVSTAISNLVASSPAALDTLNELAAALGNDANFSTTITNSLANKVDLSSNQTINGVKTFSGSLQLPNNTGSIVGTIWRSGNNLEYKDGANATKILLNSAGNLANLMDKQVALNNLVNGQVASRVLRSDGTNTTLSLLNLSTDVTNTLPIANGGTGSSTQNFVDLATNQTISGIKTLSGSIVLPNSAGSSVGTIWRNVDNLEYKDNSNTTKILLNSAGNLSNLMNKQTAINNLVGTQTANRVLRSDGTNVVLAPVVLSTDTTGILPISLGGTGSITQNFIDLTTNQTIAGIKTFSNQVKITNTTQSTSTTTGAHIVDGGQAVAGNQYTGGFSLLGDNIAIKVKQVSGTTGTAGTDVAVTHNVTGTIRGVTCIVIDIANRLMAPGMTLSGAQNEYYVYTTPTQFILYVPPTNSSNVVSRSFVALITYSA